MNGPGNQAFTSRYTGRVLRLTTEVEVFPAFDPATTPTPPQGKKYHALYDTGATHSTVSPRVVAELNLPTVGAKTLGVGGGDLATTSHLVNIRLPNGVGFSMWTVAKLALPGGPIDLLIGMDILGTGDFAVTHFSGKTTFSFCFPPRKEIDFVTDVHFDQKSAALGPKPAKNGPCPCGSGKKYKGCHGKR